MRAPFPVKEKRVMNLTQKGVLTFVHMGVHLRAARFIWQNNLVELQKEANFFCNDTRQILEAYKGKLGF